MVTGKDDIDTIDYDIHSTHGLDVQILFDVTKSESIYGITINIIKRRRVCVYIFFFPLYRTEEIGSCDSKKEREREKKAAFHSRGKIQRRASRRRINIHDERVYIYIYVSFFFSFSSFFNHFRYSFARPPRHPSHFSTKLPLPFIVVVR